MNPDLWKRVEPLFDELIEAPPDVRARRLEAIAAEAPDVHAELRRLLAEDASGGPLDQTLGGVAAALYEGGEPRADDRRSPPRSVGPYRVLAEVGHGGMGTVYLAERADGEFDHRVALKLVRGGGPDVVERFRHERQILARLRHPNVATLFDGGATDDGQPYFAMEYVDGEPITAFCDAKRLGVGARLALFEDVCRAVDYAHRNLVVHRDLKPGNVLVTADGVVKLLDFGIAKIVEAEDGGAATTRQFLTLAYAAPEQVLGEPTQVATDVYALGVLLYELLTGKNPHGDTSRSQRLARAVIDRDPPSASTAIDEAAARERGGDPTTVRRRLEGDLDTILQKALRRSPDERYGSAEELRADLERHRTRRPISARPATLTYRLSKFARRNRVGTAAMAATVLALVAGVSGVAWQAAVAAEERDRARATRAFLLEVFSAADPMAEPGAEVTAVDLARRGADRLEEAFAGEPQNAADATHMLGTVFLRLGEYARADTMLTRAYEAKKTLGDDAGTVAVLTELAETHQWQRRLDESEARLEEALALGARVLEPDDRLLAEARLMLGMTAFHRGDFETAEATLRSSLEQCRRVHGPTSDIVRDHLTSLGSVYFNGGKPREAAEAHAGALEIDRIVNPGGGVRTGEILVALSDAVDALDRGAEAESLARESVAIFREEYPPEGHSNLAIAISNLASVLRDRGHVQEAIALGRETIDMFERRLGPDHPYVARAYNNLAVTYDEAGDSEEAAAATGEAVRHGRTSFGAGHPAMVAFLGNHAANLHTLGRHAEAEAHYREAIQIADSTGTNALGRTYSLIGLSNVLRDADRLDEAETLAREAAEVRREIVGAGHSTELFARVTWAGHVADAGRYDEARPIFDAVITEARAGLPETRSALEKSLEERAAMASRSGEPDSVEVRYLRELVDLLDERGAAGERYDAVRERLARLEAR